MGVVRLGAIDAGTPTDPPAGTTPRPRPVPVPLTVRLDLAALTVLADRTGARLPLDLTEPTEPPGNRIEERLAGTTPSAGRRARDLVRRALDAARRDPAATEARLRDLGLLDDAGTPVGPVVEALRVLAGPEVLLVLDLAVTREQGEERLRSWCAVVGADVVQLSTVTGLEVELSRYDVSLLAPALARAATLDQDAGGAETADPAPPGTPLRMPFELFTDGTEAVRRGREDLLAELVRIAPAPVRVDGAELAPAAAAEAVGALERACRGRLRVLVTVPEQGAGRRTVGVVSWLRVADAWWSLTPTRVEGVPTLTLDVVEPAHLGRSLAPVLAQVLR